MSDANGIPIQLLFDDYWTYSPQEKTSLFDAVMVESRTWPLRKSFTMESIYARNRAAWRECQTAGIKPADVRDYLGGNIDHIRRSLETGKVPDQWLWVALSLAKSDPMNWLVFPTKGHQLDGFARAAEIFRREWELPDNGSANIPPPVAVTAGKGEGQAIELSTAHAALLYKLCEDEDVLNKWNYLSGPVAHDFGLLSQSEDLKLFLKMLFAQATKLLDPSDTDTRSQLASWAPSVADPAIVLGQIAKAWNPFQLCCHFLYEEIWL